MCGICGIYSQAGEPVQQELLCQMTLAMTHRGPDGSGTYIAGPIGLGHRRLSIIDLEGGSQPISNEDNRLQVVFNGEIYNFIELRNELEKKGHCFKTRSDTEVIIHGYEEWGLDCVSHFNGMFAFALWDSNLGRLVLARDHLGIKPLYYTWLGTKLLFASEIKSLLAEKECPREVDINALADLFTFRYVPSPNTLFKGIKKLSPGHLMVVCSNGCEIKRYWNSKPGPRNDQSESQFIETYQWLLEDAVKLQLRSDVPVGLFLSSGIDSGALLAIMARSVPNPVYTFTIGFEDGNQTNETDDARDLARRFGANHTEMIVSPKDYEHYYQRYLWDLEEPVGNETAAAFYFVSMIASEKVKVALTGQGADEPWAGYHRYMGVQLSNIYTRLPNFLTDHIFKKLVQTLPRNERLKRGAIALGERDILTRFTKIYSFYSPAMKEKLFKGWLKDEISRNGVHAKDTLRRLQSDVENLDALAQMLYIDTRASLPDDLLMVNDKTSMTNSIEARVPFLDVRLVEFIETIPSNLKLKGLQGKYLHKKAIEKYLPRAVVYRKKKGFANPVGTWLRKQMRQYLGDCLLTESAAINKYFDQKYIREIVKLHDQNKEDYLRHIYLLISLELWHQQFLSQRSTPGRSIPLGTAVAAADRVAGGCATPVQQARLCALE